MRKKKFFSSGQCVLIHPELQNTEKFLEAPWPGINPAMRKLAGYPAHIKTQHIDDVYKLFEYPYYWKAEWLIPIDDSDNQILDASGLEVLI